MKTKHSSGWALVVLGGGALVYAGTLQAGGFQLTEICGKCQGFRNAGAAATAGSASTVFFNPAGMTRLPGRDFEANLHVIFPTFDFSNRDSTNAIGGTPIGRRNSDGGGKPAVVPNLFYTQAINDRLVVGVGMNGPYGLLTEYDKDWIGRYQAIKSDLFTANLNPSVAYRINNQWSVGAGLNVQYIKAELTSALDFGTLAFLAGAPGVTPSNPAFDGKSELTGDHVGIGYNLGVLFEPMPGTRFGVAFRSGVDHTLDGKLKVSGNARLAPVNPAFGDRKRDAQVDFTAPATWTLGAYHELTDRWAIMAGATWTNWKKFKEIRVEFDDGGPDSVQPENWSNVWRYAIGTTYKLDSRWTLRAGFEYDDSPVKNAADRTPRVPDADRKWLALGVGYQHSDALSFDFAYSHIFISDYSINDTEVTTGALAGVPVGSTLNGDYDAKADIISAQVSWRF